MWWCLNQTIKAGGGDGVTTNRAKDTLDSVTQPRDWIPKDLETEITQSVKYMTKILNKLPSCKKDSHLLKLRGNTLWLEGITIRLTLAGNEIQLEVPSESLCKKCMLKIGAMKARMEILDGKQT